ncbi:replication factor C subunit 1 [Trichomonascus vanleenenianus]|uniref:replication factor C subunit 1 n=1 Tax=Trichomonascus vanleenenianus TaxID=2268995 RepID=UPI003EC9BB0C
MPDIRDFFGGGAETKQKTGKRKIVEDDEVEVQSSRPARAKKPKAEDVGVEVKASEYFKRSRPKASASASSSTKSPRKRAASKKEEVVILDDDDDDVIMEEAPTKKSSRGKEETAEEVLATIPDAELPDIDPTEAKVNVRDIMARRASVQDQEPGSVDIPEAAENCLAGLTFVFTGDMPSLSRPQGQDLVKRYGGKVTGAISGKTSCVVLGDNAGPKKIQAIKEKHIKAISEDGFLQLLKRMPANGGSGEAARKAMEKKAQEEAKVLADAKEMDEQFEQEAKATAAAAAKKAQSKAKEPKNVKVEPKTESSRSGKQESAEMVLARVPDAELPHVDPSAKVNMREVMARQAAVQDQVAGGSVDIPEAAENCLAGLTFVFTGDLPNLSRTQGQDLVKRYGGKVTGSVSGKTSCVVLGDNAGPKKIQTIKEKKIKAITEAGFLQLLREMPSNGGCGEAAQKAMDKKAKEEAKMRADAKEMEDEYKRQEAAAAKAAAEAKTQGKEVPRGVSKEQLWTTKYAPKQLKDICGNKAAVTRLAAWLENWHHNKARGFAPTGAKDGSEFRAALLSGSPGIGKTTSAHLIAKLQGYDVIESNASDVRSKSLLAQTVSKTLDNQSLAGYFNLSGSGEAADVHKRNVCLIMDEVDGMSAGDRGGVGQMAAICRMTKVPIILICNDKSLPKMRPFDRVSFDIPFRKPEAAQIRSRLLSICHREGVKVDASVIDQLVESTRGDIRQILNLLSTYARTEKSMNFDQSKGIGKSWEKHVVLRPFDITSRLLSGGMFAASNNYSLNDKVELYFHDPDFTPLMIQENYLYTRPNRASSTHGGHLELAMQAAESISDGDLVDKMIHGSQQQWSLMPLHGMLSSVRPASLVAGPGTGMYRFTSVLGNMSKTGKYSRLLQEIHSHTRTKLSSDRFEMRLQYLPILTEKLLTPLLDRGDAGISEVIELLDHYYLTKEDWDVIMELGVGANKPEDRLKKVASKTKAAFTRQYGQMDHPTPYMKSAASLAAPTAKKTADVPDLDEAFEKDPEPEEEDTKETADDNDITKDKYIKQAKPRKKPAAKKRAAPKKKTAKK